MMGSRFVTASKNEDKLNNKSLSSKDIRRGCPFSYIYNGEKGVAKRDTLRDIQMFKS
nr:MAG TPA: hypothetical protein [Caudoviricetes sp.]